MFRNLTPGTYSIEAWRKETDAFDMIQPYFDQIRKAGVTGETPWLVDVRAGETTVHNTPAMDN